MKKFSALVGGLALGLAVSGPAVAQVEVDPKLPAYEKVSGISGSLNSVGSDTLNNLMTLWAEGFKKVYPNVNVQIEGKGSSTAPPALIEATAQLGPMSRAMKSSEMDTFEKKFGYKATPLRTSLDSLAVFVNKDNPLQGLSLDQVDAMFSKTLRCGAADEVSVWGDLGLSGNWVHRAGQPVRSELGLRHLRVLQKAGAVQGGLQGYGQGTAGFGLCRAGGERGQERRRLQRYRLHHLRRPRRAAGREWQQLCRTQPGDGRLGPVSAVALPVHLHQQGARTAG